MRRAAGSVLNASADGFVILPIIDAIGLGGSDEPTPPAPIHASLTAHHSGDTPFTIAVDAPGAPPGSAQLISDKAGRNSAIVTPAPEECESIDDDLVRPLDLVPSAAQDHRLTRRVRRRLAR